MWQHGIAFISRVIKQATIVLQQDILSTTLTTIKIRVPDILSTIKSVIIYEAAPFTVTSADTFRLAAPVITSFSPVIGSAGTPVTIKGKYFDITSTVVQFGNTLAYITNVNDSVIIADVPANLSGNVKISVSAKLQTTVSAGYFNVTNPKINGVSPLSGTFNDEITISGENFVSPSVTFEGIPATIKSSTLTTIVVLVPVEIDSIPRSLTVVSGINQLTSSEKFILSPPHISSATSSLVGPGGEVTITGTGFNPEPERNIVLWDIYPLPVKSSTKTEITATWPQSVPRGNFGISVKTGGYIKNFITEVHF